MAAPVTVRRPSILGVGVVVWLASELMFFAGFFAAYFTLRAQTSPWPPEGVDLAIGPTAAATLVLLASSWTMHEAVARSARDDRPGTLRWLAVTASLGVAFLANQVVEYRDLGFSIDSHAYGSIFYLMTGFHGLHVLGGIGFMAAVASTIAGRSSAAPAEPTVTVCAYYWHFVDAVWVAMFLTLYVLR